MRSMMMAFVLGWIYDEDGDLALDPAERATFEADRAEHVASGGTALDAADLRFGPTPTPLLRAGDTDGDARLSPAEADRMRAELRARFQAAEPPPWIGR